MPASEPSCDDRGESVGRRIRDAELEKIPRLIVYGDKESPDDLAVRERGGAQSRKSLRGARDRAYAASLAAQLLIKR